MKSKLAVVRAHLQPAGAAVRGPQSVALAEIGPLLSAPPPSQSCVPRWPTITTSWQHPTIIIGLNDCRSSVGRAVLGMSVSSLDGLGGARAELNITKAPTARIELGFRTRLDACPQSGIVLQDRNIVLVVDDDLGVLDGVLRPSEGTRMNPSCFRPPRLSKVTPSLKRWFASSSTLT